MALAPRPRCPPAALEHRQTHSLAEAPCGRAAAALAARRPAAAPAPRAARARRRAGRREADLFDQLGALGGAVAARLGWRSRRRPRRQWLSSEFRRDLSEAGLGVAAVPVLVLEPLLPLAAALHAGRAVPGAADFRRAGGLNGAFPATMSWHWAANEEALGWFRPAADAVLSQLDGGYELVAASFVVADGGCGAEEARMHLDFGPPMIPRGVAATALVPLHPAAFPEEEGNLEYRPWDGEGEVAVYAYRPGEAAVFDGKLAHRTQPFRAEAFAPAGGAAAGGAASTGLEGLRVLASLSLARLPPGASWRAAVAQVLAGYGAPPAIAPGLGPSGR